jgi:hypothetical protein
MYKTLRYHSSFPVRLHGALKMQLKSVTILINFVVEAHGVAIITVIFPGRVALLADYLPKFSALYGTRSLFTAFKSARPGPCQMFLNIIRFYGEEWLAPRPTPKLENNLLSVVRDRLFSMFAATLRICRPFLHPPSKYMPCCGDRDPLA